MFEQAEDGQAVIEPRLSATILLIRDGDCGLEVLLMRRNSKLNFCGGVWVFPGGAVDDADRAESMDLTLKNAAVRETLEEAGVHIGIQDLYSVSRWITPEGTKKRFDTSFFIASVPAESVVVVDGSEIVECIWSSPEAAIQKHRQQEVDLLPPTLISLMGLAQFDYVEQALMHYQSKMPLQYLPRVCFFKDQLFMLYPGDGGYERLDAADVSQRHRCLHTPEGWVYINDIGWDL